MRLILFAVISINHSKDNKNTIMCLANTIISHQTPQSYKHAMATDLERWMILMKVEMNTLKLKHTWDLVKPPSRANIMDSMWIYHIRWDGEGRWIKDKA